MGEVQAQLRELQDRVAKVELGGPSYSSGSDRKLTLVFGGWPSDTRRSVLLHQLDKALQGLRLREYLDMEPFYYRGTQVCRSMPVQKAGT